MFDMITSFCVPAFNYSTTDTLIKGVKVFWAYIYYLNIGNYF